MDLSKLSAEAAEHHGLVTIAVATKQGMSRATWFRALDDGRLIHVHRGVARLPGSPCTSEQAIAAAVLATAPMSMASHRSAARLWGIPRSDDDPIEVIVARRNRSPDVEGVVVHRPRDMGDLTPVRPSIRLRSRPPSATSCRPGWRRRWLCGGRSTDTRAAVVTACRPSGRRWRSG
jgi:hypothetical protein